MKFAVRGMGGLWGTALFLAGLSACGSSSTKCDSNCRADASEDDGARRDAAADHANEIGGDAQSDGAGDTKDPTGPIDGAVACDKSITTACAETPDAGAFTFHCVATWSATTSDAYLCGRPEVLSYTCGAERELIDTSNDGTGEYIYAFDSAGKLYAISYSTGGATHCIAGPEAFVAPICNSSAQLFTCHPDGGAH
jgi:hypothetical protein